MSMEAQLMKGNTQTLILAVLNDGPLHGYAIAREIERRSGQALRFKEGTLYPALRALDEDGLIEGEWETPSSGAARRNYRLTPEGEAELVRRKDAWRKFNDGMSGVLNHVAGGGHESQQHA